MPTSAFVLLWSSGAIVSEIGLQHGSPLALLILRYALAFMVLVGVAAWSRTLLPAQGTRTRAVLTGFAIAGLYSTCYLLAIAGLYSTCYLLALDYGITPGALHTLLGVQPVLTVFLTERNATPTRLLGLVCSLAGLALVVSDGLVSMRFTLLGLIFAGLSLLGITAGSILQKRETQAPWVVLPLQYAV